MMDLVGYTASYLAHGQNHAQEHADHEFGAQYDDVRERYASEIQDMRDYEESEREHYEYMQKVYEAGFGEDCEAYEAYWKRLEEQN
jgi:hypothetical protein